MTMTQQGIAQAAYIHAVNRCRSYEKLLNAPLDDAVRHQVEVALNETTGRARQALRRIAYLDGVLTHREYLVDRKAFLVEAVKFQRQARENMLATMRVSDAPAEIERCVTALGSIDRAIVQLVHEYEVAGTELRVLRHKEKHQ